MNEAKKNDNEKEDHAAVKKQSKHFLAVYIIGLFSVALVLILLSYLTQERADQQLKQLSTQLTEQTSQAQGAQKRIQTLQSTVEEQQMQIQAQAAVLETLSELTGQTEHEAISSSVAQMKEQNAALVLLLEALSFAEQDEEQAKNIILQMQNTYGEKLNTLLAESALAQYQALCEQLDIETP